MSELDVRPAIVAVGYNRPESMRRLLRSIVDAYYPFDGIDLIVSIDESPQSDQVQKVADGFSWEHGNKIVKRYPERQGLRDHIIQCGDLTDVYGAVIILEDDLVVAPSFYLYAHAALARYRNDPKVVGVSLYSHAWNGYGAVEFRPENNGYDVFYGQFSISWGQCWTKETWGPFKEWYLAHEGGLPEKNTAMPSTILRWSDRSWGKYFISYMVEKDLYYIMPYVSMSTNFSEVGSHNRTVSATYQVPLQQGKKERYRFPDMDAAVKYDLFFERILEAPIAGVDGAQICVDLNGMKVDTRGKGYLLTTRRIPGATVLASFGLTMRPIDANVTNQVPGDAIFLYDVRGERPAMSEFDASDLRYEYETYGLSWKVLLRTGMKKFLRAVKSRSPIS